MLKSLSDLFQSIGVHPLVGGFLLGVGACWLLLAIKRAIKFEGVNPKADDLARFKDPNAFSSGAFSSVAATKAKVSFRLNGADQTLPDEISEQIMQMLKEGRKIEAVKIFKDASRLGLKESKHAIELLQRTSGY